MTVAIVVYKGLIPVVGRILTFELATSKGDFKSSRTYRLPKVKLAEAENIESKMQTLLSGNDELDVCILLKMLNKRLQ